VRNDDLSSASPPPRKWPTFCAWPTQAKAIGFPHFAGQGYVRISAFSAAPLFRMPARRGQLLDFHPRLRVLLTYGIVWLVARAGIYFCRPNLEDLSALSGLESPFARVISSFAASGRFSLARV